MTQIIDAQWVQFGFAGFSAVLLVFLFWLVKRLLTVIEKNNSVLAKLIDTMKEHTAHETTTAKAIEKIDNSVRGIQIKLGAHYNAQL